MLMHLHSGRSAGWQRVCFGSRKSGVQIPPPRSAIKNIHAAGGYSDRFFYAVCRLAENFLLKFCIIFKLHRDVKAISLKTNTASSIFSCLHPLYELKYELKTENMEKFGSSICFAETPDSGFRRNDVMPAKAGIRKNFPQKSLKNQKFFTEIHYEREKL